MLSPIVRCCAGAWVGSLYVPIVLTRSLTVTVTTGYRLLQRVLAEAAGSRGFPARRAWANAFGLSAPYSAPRAGAAWGGLLAASGGLTLLLVRPDIRFRPLTYFLNDVPSTAIRMITATMTRKVPTSIWLFSVLSTACRGRCPCRGAHRDKFYGIALLPACHPGRFVRCLPVSDPRAA